MATRTAEAPLLTPTDVTIGIVAEPPVARTYPKWFIAYVLQQAAAGHRYALDFLAAHPSVGRAE